MTTDDKLQCPVERRHLEMLAATIAAGYAASDNQLHSANIAEWAVSDARAIQAEVAEQGATNAELEAVCPVPPFPGIRGGGAGE